MKQKTFIMILLFVSLVISSTIQAQSKDSMTVATFDRLESQLKVQQTKIAEIEHFKDNQKELIKQTSQTIINQNALINSFGNIYIILTLLIMLVIGVSPIMVYQFGIKPSKELLKNLEGDLDSKMAQYLENTRNNQIEASIKQLKGDNIVLKTQAISFLALTQHEGFSDLQLFEFSRLLKQDSLIDSHLSTIAHLLGLRINSYADEVFRNKELLKNTYIRSSAYQYIVKSGVGNFTKLLKEVLENSDTQTSEFFIIIVTCSQQLNSSKELFENKELIDTLKDNTLKDITTYLKSSPSFVNMSEEEFSKTYLAEKMRISNEGDEK